MTHRHTNRIVIIAPNWLGDAVMSLPMVGMLRDAGHIRLCLVCPPYTARVYAGIDGIDDVMVLPKRGAARGIRRRSRVLRRLAPQAVIVLPPSFSSALTAAAARIPFRIGYGTDGRHILLRPALPAGRLRKEHLSHSYTRLGERALACIGAASDNPATAAASSKAPASSPAPVRRPAPKPAVFTDERASIQHKLSERGIPSTNFFLIVPGAVYGNAKTWPAEAFREAARQLSRRMPVVLAGGDAEREVCAGIAAGTKHIYDLSGQTSLGEFFALTESAGVLIANDSGAAHVAASLGTPVVVVFGSTSPTWTAPLGEHVVIVRSPTLCSPCFRRRCPTGLECLVAVRPEHVTEPALRLAEEGSQKRVDILPGGG